jgi:hypothetical protein
MISRRTWQDDELKQGAVFKARNPGERAETREDVCAQEIDGCSDAETNEGHPGREAVEHLGIHRDFLRVIAADAKVCLVRGLVNGLPQRPQRKPAE